MYIYIFTVQYIYSLYIIYNSYYIIYTLFNFSQQRRVNSLAFLNCDHNSHLERIPLLKVFHQISDIFTTLNPTNFSFAQSPASRRHCLRLRCGSPGVKRMQPPSAELMVLPVKHEKRSVGQPIQIYDSMMFFVLLLVVLVVDSTNKRLAVLLQQAFCAYTWRAPMLHQFGDPIRLVMFRRSGLLPTPQVRGGQLRWIKKG